MPTNPFGEVSALPVVIAFAVALFVLTAVRLHRQRKLTFPRAATGAVVAIYAAGILANTVFPIYLTPVDSGEPWTPAVALIPFSDYEIEDALTNTAVFVPLGFLIPLVARRVSWWRVILTAFTISLGIELAQLAAQAFFAGGHVADINDLLSNTAGGAIGYGIYVGASRVPALSKLMSRFRWHEDSTQHPVPEGV